MIFSSYWYSERPHSAVTGPGNNSGCDSGSGADDAAGGTKSWPTDPDGEAPAGFAVSGANDHSYLGDGAEAATHSATMRGTRGRGVLQGEFTSRVGPSYGHVASFSAIEGAT